MVRDRKIRDKVWASDEYQRQKGLLDSVKEVPQRKDLVVRIGDESVISIEDGCKFSLALT